MRHTYGDGFALRNVLGSKLDASISLMHMSLISSFGLVQHRLDAEDETTYCF